MSLLVLFNQPSGPLVENPGALILDIFPSTDLKLSVRSLSNLTAFFQGMTTILTVNDTGRVTMEVRDPITGALVDPTEINLTLTLPDTSTQNFTLSSAQITRQALGIFYRDVTFTQAGIWKILWTTTGPGAGSEQMIIFIRGNV